MSVEKTKELGIEYVVEATDLGKPLYEHCDFNVMYVDHLRMPPGKRMMSGGIWRGNCFRCVCISCGGLWMGSMRRIKLLYLGRREVEIPRWRKKTSSI